MKRPQFRLISLFGLTTGIAGGLSFGRLIVYHEDVAVVFCSFLLWSSVLFLLTVGGVWIIRRAFRRD